MNNTNYYSDFKEIKDFIAIDFETANSSRSSVCEIGLSFVEEGKITKTLSRKVKPKDNQYDYFNIQVHGITSNSGLFAVLSGVMP